jgi:hypothetical protein
LLLIALRRSSGTLRSLRSIVTALLLLAGLTLGLLPAAAQAAGPGVSLTVNTQPEIRIAGARFAGGMTIRRLLLEHNVDPESVTFINVTDEDSGQIALQKGDFGAVISDNGTETRFVGGGARVRATRSDGPIQISVNGGDIKVEASVSRDRIEAGETVTFSVSVQFKPPGAQLRYSWDFGDGTFKNGLASTSISHRYKLPGPHPARVTVSGLGGSTGRCATSCIGTDDVNVTVGEPPEQPPAPPGGGGTDPNGTGTGSGTGSGQGGSGGTGSGTGTDPDGTSQSPAAATPKPKPKPKPKPFGVTISGVLINDPGTTVNKLSQGSAAGAPRGRRQSGDDNGDFGIEIPLSGLLAMAFISLGALRERRGVKLRLA